LKVAGDGLSLITAAGGVPDSEMAAVTAAVRLPAIHSAQAGLLADMDYIADVLYGRAAK
jgi:hypothetical protein